jgi:hypothetical protein
MEPQEMRDIMAQFKDKYPNYTGLNITEMKQVLNGEKAIVHHGKKFMLMKAEDVQPGGKLDQMNAEIKAQNRRIRQQQREQQARFNEQLQANYFNSIIARAEQYLGDVMYEWFEGNLSAIEMISDEDLRDCRFEALFLLDLPDSVDREAVVNFWQKRGF